MTTESDQKPPASSAPVTQNEGAREPAILDKETWLNLVSPALLEMTNLGYDYLTLVKHEDGSASIDVGRYALRSSDEGTEERSA